MIHKEVTVNWVYEHYLTYLHLCIADCDCFITDLKLNNIRDIAFKALDPARIDKLISEVYLEYRSHSPEERRNYIRENAAQYLRTSSIKNRVIDGLFEITDKDEESEEYLMFRYIRKVINNAKQL